MSGLWRGLTIAALIGATNSSAPSHPRQGHRPLPMPAEKESRPRSNRRGPPVSYRESDDDVDDNDKDYDPHDDDDDDDEELGRKKVKKRSPARNMAKKAWYRARHPEKVAAYKKWYRETHQDLMAEGQKRYRERHRDRVAESHKRYRERYQARVAEAQKRYRERHREQRRAYQRRYEETLRERYTTDKYRARRRQYLTNKRKRDKEKKRTVEKLKALGPLKLTISLTDYLKSPSGRTPVTTYVKAFCDSLESLSMDTNVCESVSENSSAFL